MKHLVIGAGRMGRKHGSILASMGHDVIYVDLVQKRIDDTRTFDSVLICTPPEIHEKMILSCAQYSVPVFVEKPILTEPKKMEYPTISMVACNWTFCPHISPREKVEKLHIAYLPRDKSPLLDYSHFSMFKEDLKVRLFKSTKIETAVKFNNESPKLIHDNECEMFQRQMEHWATCLERKEESCYPIATATEDIIALCHQIQTTDRYSFTDLSDQSNILNTFV